MKYLHALAAAFARFVYVQLFVMACALPILMAWGLPFSVASPIGNLIFSPLLNLFLGCSSLVFFCNLCNIPCQTLSCCLNGITGIWDAALQTGDKNWLIGFARPSTLVLVGIPLCAIALVIYAQRESIWVKNALLTFLIVGICTGLPYCMPEHKAFTPLAYNGGQVTIIDTGRELSIVDPGVIGKRPSAGSWLCYTLAPFLISTTGRTVVDNFIALQINSRLCEALEQLTSHLQIKTIYLVYWDEKKTSPLAARFMSLQKKIEESGGKIVRFSDKPVDIIAAPRTELLLYPLQHTIASGSVSMPAHVAYARVDNQEITIYPAKYAKNEPNIK